MLDTERAKLEQMMNIVDDAIDRIEREICPIGIDPTECLLASVLNMMSLCCPQHKQRVIERVRNWLESIDDESREVH